MKPRNLQQDGAAERDAVLEDSFLFGYPANPWDALNTCISVFQSTQRNAAYQ